MNHVKKEVLYFITLESPIGKIFVGARTLGIISSILFLNVQFEASEFENLSLKYHLEQSKHSDPGFSNVIQELTSYFDGKLKQFKVPIKPEGTNFQQQVWNGLTRIPYGQTISYAQLAENIGHAKSYRAVGQANHKNPIPIIIPCHRVIGKDGSLTGYASGVGIKEWLLNHEKSFLL